MSSKKSSQKKSWKLVLIMFDIISGLSLFLHPPCDMTRGLHQSGMKPTCNIFDPHHETVYPVSCVNCKSYKDEMNCGGSKKNQRALLDGQPYGISHHKQLAHETTWLCHGISTSWHWTRIIREFTSRFLYDQLYVHASGHGTQQTKPWIPPTYFLHILVQHYTKTQR